MNSTVQSGFNIRYDDFRQEIPDPTRVPTFNFFERANDRGVNGTARFQVKNDPVNMSTHEEIDVAINLFSEEYTSRKLANTGYQPSLTSAGYHTNGFVLPAAPSTGSWIPGTSYDRIM